VPDLVGGGALMPERLYARGLREVTLLVPEGFVEILRQFARDRRRRERAVPATETNGWPRLSPSAELFVDPDSGARCAIRDTGAPGIERYLWTVTVFGDHQLTEGRSGELAEARSQAEAALVGYLAAWREPSGSEKGDA
jgi:hypothetical protein